MMSDKTLFIEKAREDIRGAESEFEEKRLNNATNRAYYACFHAAISALLDASILPVGDWEHRFVQSQFVGVLIHRRKVYSSELSGTLQRNFDLRKRADYSPQSVSEKEAKRAIERARLFVELISGQIGTNV